MTWRKNSHGEWNHAPWWKVAINTPLRALQRGRQYNWLLCTVSEPGSNPPGVLHYRFGWMKMRESGG